jgi:Na+:H+ antiporter, NhaA family
MEHVQPPPNLNHVQVNAGVEVNGVGAMTLLIFGSLLVGKVLGIITMFHFCVKCLGYPAPLGVRSADVHMIGLMAALGLTVALFVSEVAFENPKIKGRLPVNRMYKNK